mgnify:CR=1 FL=1
MFTLFVVGTPPLEEILRIADDTQAHLDESMRIRQIYFGTSQSFPNLSINDGAGWYPWETMIKACLDAGYWCTLDLDVSCAEGLLEGPLVEYSNFIPMISVKLPYIRQFGYNATIKLDDKDFAATNPGVWCHRLHDLQKREVFTDWSKYTKDKVLK